MRPRVFDVFQFCDELDILELRLRTMTWVHKHILTESPVTHRGEPKPLFYAENRERFAPWADRIIHVIADAPEGAASPWDRLRAQQDAGLQGLADASPDDGILVADADEIIPEPSWDGRFQPRGTGFRPRIFMYAVDWEYPHRHEGSPEPRLVRSANLTTVTAARDSRQPVFEIEHGWHFTWLGGPEAQARKLGQTCHDDLTSEQAGRITSGRAYRNGEHVSGIQMTAVDVDDSWPEWIAERECPASWFRPRGGDSLG